MDGVPVTKAFMMTVPVYDVQRVEVLRGPQGTAFGRNATLGLMNFITARPSREFSSSIDVTAARLTLEESVATSTARWGTTFPGEWHSIVNTPAVPLKTRTPAI